MVDMYFETPPREEMDGEEEDLVSSLERCRINFGGYLLQPQQKSLHIDVHLNPIPPSPPGTETPPLSPGTLSLAFFSS